MEVKEGSGCVQLVSFRLQGFSLLFCNVFWRQCCCRLSGPILRFSIVITSSETWGLLGRLHSLFSFISYARGKGYGNVLVAEDLSFAALAGPLAGQSNA